MQPGYCEQVHELVCCEQNHIPAFLPEGRNNDDAVDGVVHAGRRTKKQATSLELPATQHYLFHEENVQKKWSVNGFSSLLKKRFSSLDQIFMIVSSSMEALSNIEQD